eukprot:CAMPEP_0178924966 /NCGR_PEP_ID=MMETSP0786-20121207/17631_1 /TAXON_ID=186022 /ORGANISM="Thalassionema frauenfeldii, Strain CCMP 1798" /LENGTH=178 /DNA_ID=CAMNT_0020599757 /DNA_START=69 /DNA_END=605 /DNA_ORIENTATION=+
MSNPAIDSSLTEERLNSPSQQQQQVATLDFLSPSSGGHDQAMLSLPSFSKIEDANTTPVNTSSSRGHSVAFITPTILPRRYADENDYIFNSQSTAAESPMESSPYTTCQLTPLPQSSKETDTFATFTASDTSTFGMSKSYLRLQDAAPNLDPPVALQRRPSRLSITDENAAHVGMTWD